MLLVSEHAVAVREGDKCEGTSGGGYYVLHNARGE